MGNITNKYGQWDREARKRGAFTTSDRQSSVCTNEIWASPSIWTVAHLIKYSKQPPVRGSADNQRIHGHMVFILLNGNEAASVSAPTQGRIVAVVIK